MASSFWQPSKSDLSALAKGRRKIAAANKRRDIEMMRKSRNKSVSQA